MYRSFIILLVLAACSNDGGGSNEDEVGSDTTDADADSDADADADSDADADTDSDADTDGDTGATDTGTGGTAGEPSPLANCTGQYASSLGVVVTYRYDADGRLISAVSDINGDGRAEDTTTWTWTVVGGVATRSTWTTTSGVTGEMAYDLHEHADWSRVTSTLGTTTTTFTNTHDAAGHLTHTRTTTTGSPAVSDTDYDACERWIRSEQDLFGNGSQVLVSTTTWTLAGDCVPTRSVMRSDTTTGTTTYDAEGRPLTESWTATGVPPWTVTWTWTCP